MASNKIVNIQPIALTAVTTTNILNCGITSLSGPVGMTATQPYLIIRSVHVSNKSGSPATFSLWKGGTGGNVAGTEFIGTGISVAAGGTYDSYRQARLDAGDFIVGGASAAAALTISFEGEIGFSG